MSAAAIDYSKPIFAAKPFGFTHEEVYLWYGHEYFKKTYPSGLVPGAFEKTDGGRWYLVNGMSRGGNPDFAAFDMEEAQMHYIRRTVDWTGQAKEPFFVYYAPHIPHWPHVPAPQFQGWLCSAGRGFTVSDPFSRFAVHGFDIPRTPSSRTRW